MLLQANKEQQIYREMILEEKKENNEIEEKNLTDLEEKVEDLNESDKNIVPKKINAENNSQNSDSQESETIEKSDNKSLEKNKNPNAKWYILQAYSGYEGRVEKTIFEKLKISRLEHLVNEIFIPSEDVFHTKDGKKRKVNQKYFPGYVLINMELTSDLWHLLMDVNRVSGFIGGTQKNPLPLDDKELEEIRTQVNEGIQQKATEEEFTLGQKVTITEGSFGNFSGIIDEINQERKKLKVLVSIFGRPTPVEVEFEKVKHLID